jgi:hypothetical protein
LVLAVALGELGADDVEAGVGEDALGARPAVLEHVDAGQDAQRQHVAALGEVLDDEVGGGRAERVPADGRDEGDRAVGVDAAVEHDDRQLLAGGLDGGRQGGGGVRRDDQDVAVAAGQEAVDVADLLVVGALGVDVDEAAMFGWRSTSACMVV